MNADKAMRNALRLIFVPLCAFVFSSICGCGSPNKANIALRKENQELNGRIQHLELARKQDIAALRAAEQSKGTLQTLPQERLDRLFTATDLKLGRLTGGSRTDPDASSDDAIKIYAVPTDQSGDEVKLAGSFVIEAFDLQQSDSPLVGRWEFSTDEARTQWFGSGLLYEYVLRCPLKVLPRHDSLTVHVTFTDELTQRTLQAQKVIQLTIAGAPATQPAVKVDQ